MPPTLPRQRKLSSVAEIFFFCATVNRYSQLQKENPMPPQSRVQDQAMCPADSHGKPCCSHSVKGPGVSGSTNILAYYCDLNRAGRRFFRFSENTPVGLWPLILGRITTMKMPLMYDPWLIAEKEEIESPPLPDDDHEREQPMRRASALFHLVRNSPLLATGIAR